MQNRDRSAEYCDPGEHYFIEGTIQQQTGLFQVAERTIVYCRACPFHYFPEYQPPETNTSEQPIQDD